MLKRALLAAGAVLVAAPCFALDFQCTDFKDFGNAITRPEPPTCVESMIPPVDQFEFDDCRDQIETYKSKLNDYLACLKSESEEVVSDYNDLVRRFNCLAAGMAC